MVFERILVKLIAPKVHLKRTDGDTEFEWDTNTIYYNPNQTPQDVGFLRHIEEKHFFANPSRYPMSLWSMLHELGHYFNPNEEIDYEGKALCAFVPYEYALTNTAIQDRYYDSPDEYTATEWAIEWIVKHPFLSKCFTALLR